MQLNADFNKRAVVHAARLPWTPSPTPGVERRMLDRDGDEVARATSIVRYAPGSAFPAHTHGGGEEFLVLEGVFADEHGDYPAGSYVRNPPTSRHVPRSGVGCTLFVKLRQFDPDDRKAVRIDTTARSWQADGVRPQVEIIPLHRDAHETVRLERWGAHAVVELDSPDGLELLAIEGSFRESGEDFAWLSWLRLPAGDRLRAKAGDTGALVWLKAGVQPASLTIESGRSPTGPV